MTLSQHYFFLSPHLDDAVFSCGDYISKLSVDSSIDIITIFSGYPTQQKLQPDAVNFHKQCNLGEFPIEARKKEDELACTILQCNFTHLEYWECLYRKDDNDEFIFKNIYDFKKSISEEKLKINIVTRLKKIIPQSAVVLCPLGIGGHVDHLLVFEIGKSLEADGYNMIFYEDVPYVSDITLKEYYKYTQSFIPVYIPLREKDWLNRLSAILCYSSQITIIWKNVEKLIANLRKLYSRNPDKYSIRLWKSIT